MRSERLIEYRVEALFEHYPTVEGRNQDADTRLVQGIAHRKVSPDMGYRAYIRRRSSPASPDAFDATSERPAFSKPLRARHFPTLKRPAICLKKVIGYKSFPS